MGRYDGEDYADVGYCQPGTHQIAPNGTCWICHNLIRKSTPSRKPVSTYKPKHAKPEAE